MRLVILCFVLLVVTSCVKQQDETSEKTAKSVSKFEYANIVMEIPSEWKEMASLHITEYMNTQSNLRIVGHSFGRVVDLKQLQQVYLAKLKKRFTSVTSEKQTSLCDGKVTLFSFEGTLLKRPYAQSKSFNKFYNHAVLSAIVATDNEVLNFWVDGPMKELEREKDNFTKFLNSYREVTGQKNLHLQASQQDELVDTVTKNLKTPIKQIAGDSNAVGDRFDFGPFSLAVPNEWVEIAPQKQMRAAEFSLKDHTEYTVIAFNFGKVDFNTEEIVAKNIDRWRGQFTKLEEEKRIPLEKASLALVYFRGTFVKKENVMDANGTEMKDFCVLNAVVPSSDGPYYFRLEGPQSIIDAQLTNMVSFLNSHVAKKVAGASQEIEFGEFALSIPGSWEKVKPKSNMRKAELRLRDHPNYTVVAFHFGEDKFSGLEERIKENFARWEKQFDKIDDKKVIDLAAPNSALLYLEGTFFVKPFPAADGKKTPGYVVLNALIDTTNGPYFFRLAAPKEIADGSLEDFKLFLNSYHQHGSGGHGGNHVVEDREVEDRELNDREDEDEALLREDNADFAEFTNNIKITKGELGERVTVGDHSMSVPTAWEQVTPKSSMRKAEFRLRTNPEFSIPAFNFGNDQFSSFEERVQQNVRRWEGQFQKVSQKKMIELSNKKAALLYLSGTFVVKASPMAETGNPTGGYAAMNGLIDTDNGPYFFRLVAPKEILDKQIGNFKAFLESFK